LGALFAAAAAALWGLLLAFDAATQILEQGTRFSILPQCRAFTRGAVAPRQRRCGCRRWCCSGAGSGAGAASRNHQGGANREANTTTAWLSPGPYRSVCAIRGSLLYLCRR
jgi:hypothetical protein